MFKNSLKDFLCKYKVTIFFLLTYWAMDPILYFHFGNAYISQSPTENKWLVLLAGPFSFSEDFQSNTPILSALLYSFRSGNFWFPFLTILFSEWRIPSGFSFWKWRITTGKSYTLAVVSSYVTSALAWAFVSTHVPVPGTSIIAVCLILTFLSGYYLVRALRSVKSKNGRPMVAFLKYYLMGGLGVLFVLWFYVFGNGAFPFHAIGFFFYIALSYVLMRKF